MKKHLELKKELIGLIDDDPQKSELKIHGVKVLGTRAFSISMLIGSLWTLSNGLEMAGLELFIKLFWANMQYIAYGFSPVAWFVMLLEFIDRADWES